jgi:hypothetical protein
LSSSPARNCTGHRAHGVAGEFFLAAPDHLDRAAHGLGQLDRLREGHGRLVQEVTTEETAQQGRMDGDLLRRQSGLLGDVAWNISGAWLGSHISSVPSALKRAVAEGGSSWA